MIALDEAPATIKLRVVARSRRAQAHCDPHCAPAPGRRAAEAPGGDAGACEGRHEETPDLRGFKPQP
jgi:hypothetical protein